MDPGSDGSVWRWLPFEALGIEALYQVVWLRELVFVVEQDCAYLDADGRDRVARHLLVHRGPDLIAYLRAFAPGDDTGHAHDATKTPQMSSIGRVVVAPGARGLGLGRRLMRAGMHHVWQTWGDCPVHLSAQAHLASFYGALGYAVVGEGYLEDGIPHLPMVCPGEGALPPADPR